MKINLKKAIKTFHPSPSFDQIYYEAVANAIDASASVISIAVAIDSYEKPQTLRIEIKDNGVGFTKMNFQRFSSLLEVETSDHKGLGRLIYLAYFNEVIFTSTYEGDKRRSFTFDQDFSGKSQTDSIESENGTTAVFTSFTGDRVNSYAYLVPSKIKESLLKEFFPLFFAMGKKKKSLAIKISLATKDSKPEHDFYDSSEILTIADLPVLKECNLENRSLDLFQTISVHYSVEKDLTRPRMLRTCISVDGRAIDWELLLPDVLPAGYKGFFLFSSDYFKGKVNSSRQKLDLPDELTEKMLKVTLRNEIGRILDQEIPEIAAGNKKVQADLDRQYPHLFGYFPKRSAGLINRNFVLEEAQKVFFNEQRKLLECEIVDQPRYEKALELSSRALMEYVLYRARIIDRLKSMSPINGEQEIHELIVPMKRQFSSGTFEDDIYNNNVWMLDDKYMSYNTILSDKAMSSVVEHIALEEIEDDGRPDITIVFSSDPATNAKVSVVVVELKKHGVGLAKKEEVVSQLRQRARKLLKYYPDKIERIWFYGVTDIDQEFSRSLREDEFKELFSCGHVFYKPQRIIVEDDLPDFIADLFVMNYEALVNDAAVRNSTFIRILKARIAQFLEDLSTEDILAPAAEPEQADEGLERVMPVPNISAPVPSS